MVTLATGSAMAQPSGREELARRDLIEQAEQARRSGDHARVVELAEQAGRIRQTPSLRWMLANARAELGQVVSGLAEARACVREAEIDAGLRQREAILAGCRGLVEQLEHRVGYVTLRVEGGAPEGLVMHVAGDEVNAALLGAAVPVRPGQVQVVAEAPGRERFEQTVEVAAEGRAEVTVRMRLVEAEAVGEDRGTTGGIAPPRTAGSRQRPATSSGGGVRAAAWGTLAASLVLAGVGTAMIVLRESPVGDYNRDCEAGESSGACGTLLDDITRYEAAAIGTFVGAGVSAVVSVVLFAVSGSPSQTRVSIIPRSDGAMGGLAWTF